MFIRVSSCSVPPQKGPTYVEEQAIIKRDFLAAAGDSEEDDEEGADGDVRDKGIGGGLKVRSRAAIKAEGDAEAKIKDMIGSVFGEEADMDDGDKFLRNFILNKVSKGRRARYAMFGARCILGEAEPLLFLLLLLLLSSPATSLRWLVSSP